MVTFVLSAAKLAYYDVTRNGLWRSRKWSQPGRTKTVAQSEPPPADFQ
jgi:hypothetical protein